MLLLSLLCHIAGSLREYGVRNTIWFIFYLNCDEFSIKLNLKIYHNEYGRPYYRAKLYSDRQLAHEMDEYFNEE